MPENTPAERPAASLPAFAQRAKALLSTVANIAQNMGNTGGAEPILSIDKVGRWQFGPEHTLVAADALVQVDPFSMEHGYVAWKESKPVGEVLVPGMQAKPDPTKLPNHGVPWQECYALRGRFITGPDRGTVVVYKPSSMGGANAIKKLLADIYRQAEVDPAALMPVLRLESGSYQNKTYGGLTYYPVLPVVRWDPTPEEGEPVPMPPAEPNGNGNGGAPAAAAAAASAAKDAEKPRTRRSRNIA